MTHRKYRSASAKKRRQDKPAAEKIWRGIPEVEIYDPDPDMPIFIEKHRPNRVIRVENGDMLTPRLGMHSCSRPAGIGAFSRDCVAICTVPMETAKEQSVNALFAQPDIAPAVFMDCITLSSDVPFHLELVEGSARLELNCGAKALPLEDKAIGREDNTIVIVNEIQKELPKFYTYTFDFITIQVRIVSETVEEGQ